MIANTSQVSLSNQNTTASISVLVLIRNWALTTREQKQLQLLAQVQQVQELILVGRQVQALSEPLANEAKVRCYGLNSSSTSLQTEAGAFEAVADVLVILHQGVGLPGPVLLAAARAVEAGCCFGGFIPAQQHWRAWILKKLTFYCRGLFWFRLTKGYFMCRKMYHHAGGLKHDGRLLSFFELLCRQKKLSRYTFLFY
jgi:hypothetical protein